MWWLSSAETDCCIEHWKKRKNTMLSLHKREPEPRVVASASPQRFQWLDKFRIRSVKSSKICCIERSIVKVGTSWIARSDQEGWCWYWLGRFAFCGLPLGAGRVWFHCPLSPPWYSLFIRALWEKNNNGEDSEVLLQVSYSSASVVEM